MTLTTRTVLVRMRRGIRTSAATVQRNFPDVAPFAVLVRPGRSGELEEKMYGRKNMSKGSNRRPCQLTREEEEQRWIDAFGPRPIPNVMSTADRESLRDYLTELHDREDLDWQFERTRENEQRDRETGGDVPADGHEGGDLHAKGPELPRTDPAIEALDAAEATRRYNESFWHGPDYRGEYTCPHGVGHGNHIHGCDGCCSRDDFPGQSAMRITNVPLERAGQGFEDGIPRKEGRCKHCGGVVYSCRGEMPLSCSGCASDF